jgi:hypothetical protein
MANAGDYPSIEQLLDEARTATGLSDFGAGNFREGLGHLLRSLECDARLSPGDREEALRVIRRRLTNRLKIEEHYRLHPDIARQQVAGPAIVTGLTRTGSTALGNMLSLDPQFRSLRQWEQDQPVPPPVAGAEHADPRRIAHQAAIDHIYREEPWRVAQHIYEVDASVEDTEILGLEFGAQQLTMPVFGYFDWWREADHRATFAYHRRVTTLLQSGGGSRFWLFKAPHHTFHLDALLTAYPDARFVMTHRDPARVVPSYTSLVMRGVWGPETSARHDPRDVGRYISMHLRRGIEQALATRDRIGEDRFIDIHHHDFNSDPHGTLERIYAFLGIGLKPEMHAAADRWLRRHRSGAHGDHAYSPEEFGLTADGIRSDYAFYIERFGVRT